jgi:hypothetical protein
MHDIRYGVFPVTQLEDFPAKVIHHHPGGFYWMRYYVAGINFLMKRIIRNFWSYGL